MNWRFFLYWGISSHHTIALRAKALVGPLAGLLRTKLRLHARDAVSVVEHLIRSEQAGKSSHGLVRVHYTVTSGKFGPYRGKAAPRPHRVAPGLLHVEGRGHFGYSLLHEFVSAGCAEAKRHGLCVATGSRVYPSGSLGDWARMASRQGVGLFLVASSPRRVAAPGGRRPVIGTNAICIGLPAKPQPFVADCATSEISHGVLLLARLSGMALPPNSAVDSRGRPTTSARLVDPTKNMGALLPFGGSHKSFALAMGIELLAALGGGKPGEVEAGRHGVFAVFLGPKLFSGKAATLSSWLSAQSRSGTRIPGWTSGDIAARQIKRGVVEIPLSTYEALSSLIDLEPFVVAD